MSNKQIDFMSHPKSKVASNSSEDDINKYLIEINNLVILNNMNFIAQGSIFYNILQNGEIIYIDPKTGDIPCSKVIEKSFYDEAYNLVNNNITSISKVIDILEERSFSKFDLNGYVMYATFIINNIKKRIWISTITRKLLKKNDIEIVAKNNNWLLDKGVNLWFKWNENGARSWLDLEWNPVNNYPSTLEEDNFRKLQRIEYEKLPLNLRASKLRKSDITYYFPKPKLICEINE